MWEDALYIITGNAPILVIDSVNMADEIRSLLKQHFGYRVDRNFKHGQRAKMRQLCFHS